MRNRLLDVTVEMRRLTGRAKYIDRIREELKRAPTSFLGRSIESLGLPPRSFNGLKRARACQVGDLLAMVETKSNGFPGLGSVSLKGLHAALIEGIENYIFSDSEEPQDPVDTDEVFDVNPQTESSPLETKDESFAQLLEKGFASIDERAAHVIRERSGVYGRQETLEAVARPLGLTRERIRQIQAKAMNRLKRQFNIGSLLESRLLQLLEKRDFPLYLAGLPAEDPWFAGIPSPEAVLDFLIDNLQTSKLGTIVLHGRKVVSQVTQGDWDRKVDSATAFVKESCGRSLNESVVRAAVEAIAGTSLKDLSEELYRLATKRAIYVEKPEGRILVAYGVGATHKVQAILENTNVPLHYTEIATRVAEAFGPIELRRVHAAVDDVGHLLGRGIYGLRRHIDVTDAEATYLVSLAEVIVREGPEGRQWHASELLADLGETETLADGLSHYELSVLLKQHSNLQYMGRQVWAQASENAGQRQKRLDIHNVVESTLRDGGAPMSTFEIYKRVSSIRGIGTNFQIHAKGIVFKVGPSMWGLLTRDLCVTHQDLQGYLQFLESDLKKSKTAIHVSEIQEKLKVDMPGDDTAWQVFGAAQIDPRFKSFYGDYLGLVDWSSTGRLAVHEAVKMVIENLVEGATTEQIQERIESHLGRRISAEAVKCALRDHEASYDRTRGVWVLDLAAELDEEDRDSCGN